MSSVTLSPESSWYLESLLAVQEDQATDYSSGEELREWAQKIDRLRAEAGLPLVSRPTGSDPSVTEPMTFEEELRIHGALHGRAVEGP